MVEIRRLDESISQADFDALVELYFLSFRSRMSVTEQEIRTRASESLRDVANDHLIYAAYEMDRPVGVLSAGRCKPERSWAAWLDAALDYFHIEDKESDEARIKFEALYLITLGAMVFYGPPCVNPRDVRSEFKITRMEDEVHMSVARKTTPRDVMRLATAVHPDYRGLNGIASKLSQVLEEDARADGANRVLTVCSNDPTSLELNHARGYKLLLMFQPFYADRSPGYFMVKDLGQPRGDVPPDAR